ncbi:MAG: hypothetical protein U9N03_06835 [Candidatus Caldatribacteriota bacterium]|nr:hypothetical protein [Candidatus Caldatribacteriota bacterium]
MKVRDLIRLLDAEVLSGEDFLDQEITDCGASDLLSDILAYSKDNYVLLTGLTSLQVVRTAELTGAIAIVFVRGKLPPQEAIGLARSHHIPLLRTEKLMFESCKKIVKEVMKEENK